MDPVVKNVFMVDMKGIYYGVALRKSGGVDLYKDMTLVDSKEKGKHHLLRGFSLCLRYLH